jgi:hypothetical protein
VARCYIAVGISSQNVGSEAPSAQFSANRAFVQWAGFTAGLSVSFYDFYPAAALLYRAAQVFSEDTGDGGWWVWAYTAQFGGGFSATLSAEERRMSQIIGQSGTVATTISNGGLLPGGAFSGGAGYGGWQSPDVVANLRVDQAWGSAQVMGALHQVNALYYGAPALAIANGGPSTTDSWGWVIGAGLKVNAPFVAPGDYFVGEVNYTEGATKYLNNGPNAENQTDVNGGTVGYGVGSDCVYGGSIPAGTATNCNLTTAYSFNAAYEHYWTPQWHESFVGGMYWEKYGGRANAILCSLEGGGNGAGIGNLAVATPGCNNNWSFWAVGSRLQWDVTKSFYIGVEAIYEQINTASTFNGLVPGPILANIGTANIACAAPSVACPVSSQSNWTFTIRMHKDFLP